MTSNISFSISQDIVSQNFDGIQADVALQKQVLWNIKLLLLNRHLKKFSHSQTCIITFVFRGYILIEILHINSDLYEVQLCYVVETYIRLGITLPFPVF